MRLLHRFVPARVTASALALCFTLLSVSSGYSLVELPYYWHQNDPRWAGAFLGDSDRLCPGDPDRFSRYGCVVTSLAMLLGYYGVTNIDAGRPLNPPNLNDWLDENWLFWPGTSRTGCPNSTRFSWEDIEEVVAALGPYANGMSRSLKYLGTTGRVCAGRPGLAWVDCYLGPSAVTEYPLPVRVVSSRHVVCSGHQMLLLDYVPLFIADLEYIADPAQYYTEAILVADLSWDKIDLVVPSTAAPCAPPVGGPDMLLQGADAGASATNARLAVSGSNDDRVLVIDPLGRRVGQDSLGTTYAEIPMTYEVTLDPITNDADPDSGDIGGPSVVPGIHQPAPGRYNIMITDIAGDGSSVFLRMIDQAGNRWTRTIALPGGGQAPVAVVQVDLDSVMTPGSLADGDVGSFAECYVVPLRAGAGLLYLADRGLNSGFYCTLPDISARADFDPEYDRACMASGRLTSGVFACTYVSRRGAVGGGNHNPVGGLDSLSSDLTGRAAVSAETLLANDYDADGDSLHIAAVGRTAESHGTVSLVGDSVVYVADAGYSGMASFVYALADTAGGRSAAAVVVDVRGIVSVGGVAENPKLSVRIIGGRPAVDGVIRLAIGTASGEPVSCTVIDIAGRMLERLSLAGGGGGEVIVALGTGGRLPPGVYLVEVRQGVRRARVTVVLLR